MLRDEPNMDCGKEATKQRSNEAKRLRLRELQLDPYNHHPHNFHPYNHYIAETAGV